MPKSPLKDYLNTDIALAAATSSAVTLVIVLLVIMLWPDKPVSPSANEAAPATTRENVKKEKQQSSEEEATKPLLDYSHLLARAEDDTAFARAQEYDSIAAYEAYMKLCTRCAHREKSEARIAQLQEEAAAAKEEARLAALEKQRQLEQEQEVAEKESDEPDTAAKAQQVSQANARRIPNVGAVRHIAVNVTGYAPAACMSTLKSELRSAGFNVVGSNPDAVLNVSTSQPRYYEFNWLVSTATGYDIDYSANLMRTGDNRSLFQVASDEDGHDQLDACVEAMENIADDLEDAWEEYH